MDLERNSALEKDLLQNFAFTPTGDQRRALQLLSGFCLDGNPRNLFILRGYAGTGKTTLIQTLVKTLPDYKMKTVLLAPTGRAAKVMGKYANRPAFTIHKHIYRPKNDRSGGAIFQLKENKATNTLYIIDEASMIGDQADNSLASGSLLADLLTFINDGKSCKLMLVGDVAQLPPIGARLSPALNTKQLRTNFGMETTKTELKEVMRQAQDSQILENATMLREKMLAQDYSFPKFKTGADVIRLTEGADVQDALDNSFHQNGREQTALITRSNKRATLFNRQIRAQVLYQEEEISAGDFLMVVKNNYHWLPQESRAGFIANGDIIELLKIREINEIYDLRFARCSVRMVDYPGEKEFDTVLMLSVLDLPAASLSWDESKQFYNKILEDYKDIPNKYQRHKEVRDNPFFNALQVKFAYAITCHKAQGGQWENVFVEKPWLPEGGVDLEYFRWLYTAVTRAQTRLFLMGFGEEYF